MYRFLLSSNPYISSVGINTKEKFCPISKGVGFIIDMKIKVNGLCQVAKHTLEIIMNFDISSNLNK